MALSIDAARCPQNHRCPLLTICPTGAIAQQGMALPQIDPQKCIECGKCVSLCPKQAIQKVQGMEDLCKIRDIQRAVKEFEQQFEKRYGICMNEGMALCSLHRAERLSSGQLGELLGLSASNTSKVICSIEKKGFVERVMGEQDRRQMYFSLTPSGLAHLASLKCEQIETAPLLKKILEK